VVVLLCVAAAVAIGVPVAVTAIRAPRRSLAHAARQFEEHKSEVGAVLAEDLERMREALASAVDTSVTAAALGKARDHLDTAAHHAVTAAAADGRTYSAEIAASTRALAAAARELAAAEASVAGAAPPDLAPPCILDPAHGASSTTVSWTPAGGRPRPVPVCAADADRIASGVRPEVRMVVTEGEVGPYFDAHGQFVDWLLGYYAEFDPYLTARLLAGTPIGAHLPDRIRARHGVASDPIGEFGRPAT
jgi:hypothetical protein